MSDRAISEPLNLSTHVVALSVCDRQIICVYFKMSTDEVANVLVDHEDGESWERISRYHPFEMEVATLKWLTKSAIPFSPFSQFGGFHLLTA